MPDDVQQTIVAIVGGECLCDMARLAAVSASMRSQARDAVFALLEDEHSCVRGVAVEAAIKMAQHETSRVRYVATMQALVRRVEDGEGSVRLAALGGLGCLVFKGDDEAPAVTAACAGRLQDCEDEVRHAAYATLRGVAGRDETLAVSSVVAATDSAGICDEGLRARVRQEALENVGALVTPGNAHAVAATIRSLADPCDDVRREAIGALGEVASRGDDEVVRVLCDCMDYPDSVGRSAATVALSAVANRGDRRVVDALTALLADVQSAVRCRALEALGAVAERGDEPAASAAARCLVDTHEGVRSAAAKVSALLMPSQDVLEVGGTP